MMEQALEQVKENVGANERHLQLTHYLGKVLYGPLNLRGHDQSQLCVPHLADSRSDESWISRRECQSGHPY